ncbi:MAG: DUF2490 domain-containing protein [Myxococcota bacterium]
MIPSAFVGLLTLSSPALAQTTQDIAVWTAVLASPDVTDRTRIWFDAHARRDQGRFLAIVRPGVGLQLTDAVSGWVGYGWIPSVPDDGETTHEHRIWEQVIANLGLGDRLTLQSRTRFEQRFSGGGGAVALRLREFVRLTVDPSAPERVRLALWDELFVGLGDTDWGAVGGLDQNRLFVGAGLPIRPGGRVEIGLLNVLLPREDLNVTWAIAANWFPPRRIGG